MHIFITLNVVDEAVDWCPRQHSKQLISKTAELNNRDYIVRMLYRDAC